MQPTAPLVQMEKWSPEGREEPVQSLNSVFWNLGGDPRILDSMYLQEMLVPGLQGQEQSWDGDRAHVLWGPDSVEEGS